SSTGGSRAGAGGAAIGGKGATAGAPIAAGAAGSAAMGGVAGSAASGGAATGGVATGGAATGGAPPAGGAPPQVILQYKFDESTGETAVDSTPNHHDGTVSNTTWLAATGRNGGCISYAAADSQVTVPSNLLGTSKSLTVSAWVKLTSNPAENRLFYFGTSDGTSYLTLTFNNSTSGISVRFKAAAGTEQVLTTPTQLPVSIWKHVTVSVSNVGAALYIDGKIVAQDNTLVMDPTTLGTPMTNLVGSSPTAGQAFQGLIDEFYVYNGIIPMSEIRQLAWPKSDYTAYHLDEGTGTSTADSSERGANGTLMGGATWVPSPFGTGVRLTNSSNPAVPAEQYVALLNGALANCTTALTLSAWINLTTNMTDGPVLEFAKSDTLLTNLSTYATAKGQAVLAHYFLDDSKTFTVRQLGTTYTLGQWTHIAAVRGDNANGIGRFAAVYLNGVQVLPLLNTGTGAYYVTDTPLSYLGRSHVAAMAGFNGEIDEVLVSCRQYTDDEIKQLAYRPQN
ncbi:MAG TPA: LamG domain-containing protein, partial [Polyangiaceae bacterium]